MVRKKVKTIVKNTLQKSKTIKKKVNTLSTNKFHQNIYLYSLYFLYLLIILSYFSTCDFQDTITSINFWTTAYIGLILMIRYNPWMKNKLTDFDRKLVFSSSIILIYPFILYLLNYNQDK